MNFLYLSPGLVDRQITGQESCTSHRGRNQLLHRIRPVEGVAGCGVVGRGQRQRPITFRWRRQNGRWRGADGGQHLGPAVLYARRRRSPQLGPSSSTAEDGRPGYGRHPPPQQPAQSHPVSLFESTSFRVIIRYGFELKPSPPNGAKATQIQISKRKAKEIKTEKKKTEKN